MFDFCYMANILLLAHLWAAPRSDMLSKVRALYICRVACAAGCTLCSFCRQP